MEYTSFVKNIIARLNNFYKNPIMVLDFSMQQALYYAYQIHQKEV